MRQVNTHSSGPSLKYDLHHPADAHGFLADQEFPPCPIPLDPGDGDANEITAEELIPKLQAIAKNGYDERLYVRGDRATDYGTVMRLMGALNQAGYRRIGLVTLQEQQN